VSDWRITQSRRPAYVLAACVALAFGLLHQAFVGRAYPDALYMDSLRLLYQVQAWQQGQLSFGELWGVGSAHRGFINPLLLMANIRFFSLDVMLVNRMTGVVVGLVALVLVYQFNRGEAWSLRGADAPATVLRVAVSVMLAGLCFSWSGFELFTLDLGLPLWIKNLCFVLFFTLHGWLLASRSRMLGTAAVAIALALAGVLIVMFVGMGWSYAFAGALVGVQVLALVADQRSGQVPRPLVALRLLPVGAVVAALAWSVLQGASSGQVEEGDSLSRLAGELPGLGRLALYALGSAWIGYGALGQYGLPSALLPWLGAVGVAMAVYGIVDRLRRGLRSGSLLPLYLVGYGILTALSVAAARGDGGFAAVVASRYYMDLALFLAGVLWLTAEAVLARRTLVSVTTLPFLVLAVSVLLGLALSGYHEWKVAPYRAKVFEAMNLALRRGVPGEAEAQLLQSPLEHARLGVAVLRERRLGPFAGLRVQSCVPDNVIHSGDWSEREPGGRWMGQSASLDVPPGCGCSLEADLFLPGQPFIPRHLTVSSGGNTLAHVPLEPGATARLVLPLGADEGFQLSVSQVTVPAEVVPGSPDVRRLGVYWTRLALACETSAQAR